VAQWFAQKFPKLPDEFGDSVLEEPDKNGRLVVYDICQPFLAATLGEDGTPDAPTIYLPAENRFYTYSSEEGVYVETREAALLTRLSLVNLFGAVSCYGLNIRGCKTAQFHVTRRKKGSLGSPMKPTLRTAMKRCATR
jgi:hypothetical protein